MKKSVKVLAILALLTGILAACNFPLANNQSDEDAVATSVAQTVAAANAQVLPTATMAQPTNTLPALPTVTSQVTNTVSAYPTSTALPCNQAVLVSEDPIDDKSYNAGATFTKTWTFKNVGTCTWNTNYKLVFISGNAMGGPASKNLASSVAPGQSVSLSVNLTAPSSAGTHKGTWNLQGDDGVNFANFWVQIKVPSATATAPFAVTGVVLSAVGGDSAACSPAHTFNYQAVVTASAAGTVTYYFTHDGTSAGAASVTFSAAGSKTITGSWDLDVPDSTHEVKLYIDNPNHQSFGSLTLTCTP